MSLCLEKFWRRKSIPGTEATTKKETYAENSATGSKARDNPISLAGRVGTLYYKVKTYSRKLEDSRMYCHWACAYAWLRFSQLL
jgi:hypothetical protein